MNKTVVIIGPAHPLRGGLASFNERLAKQFILEKNNTSIFTFSLQYPNFLFPGTTQYSSEPEPKDLNITVNINSVNPFNWIKVGLQLKKLKPNIIVVRYWLPFMGPCLGTILRIAKKNKISKIICIADNIIPHEKRPGDMLFTKYFVKPIDAFVTMSKKVQEDLSQFSAKPVKQITHPLYDNFGDKILKTEARKKLQLPLSEKIILFFGFIRKYKGLDLLLESMAVPEIKNSNIKLLIAGEFYDDKEIYNTIIRENNLESQLILHTDFIADRDVKYYLSACDFVIQPYKSATQSGVTPLAYHFEKPMLVTNVGALPDLVPNEKVGLVCEPNAQEIAKTILRLYELGDEFFIPFIQQEKKKYTWNVLTETINSLAQ
jgi:glycosyltransferase involved in cell wall biosynthesis